MKKVVVLFLLLCVAGVASAKTERFGTWIEFELSKKLFKTIEFSIIPEVRLQDDWTVDEYLIDGKIAYSPFKFLEVAAAYRYNVNVKNKENEEYNRFVFDATGSYDFGRFENSLRARLTNYFNEDDEKSNFFRVRLKSAYDIKGSKFKPYTSYELFRNISTGEFKGGRFDAGFTRKLGKFHRVGLYYRLQDYYSSQESIHILGIDYRFKF
ncbi:DUF2490 domain-containing protein [uncultured Draconibacterium sp.]|uniref:DUF2490 domain-containing protein n=1 Tax=uncultured Draconibacterium sp. TaxID=1573823 RepID=UPI00325FF0B6